MDDRLHSEKELKTMLPMAILCEIPEVASPADEQNDKKKIVMGWATAAAVVTTILIGSVFSFLHD
jgi:polysaccharide biosynthesis transport protein